MIFILLSDLMAQPGINSSQSTGLSVRLHLNDFRYFFLEADKQTN